MTTITISIDDNSAVNVFAPAADIETKAAKILEVLDELKENTQSYIPKHIQDAAFGAVADEICSIMKG